MTEISLSGNICGLIVLGAYKKRPFLGKGLLLDEFGIDQVAVKGAHECSHVILVRIITNGNQLWKGSMLLKVV